jgi:chorismate mutase
MNHITASHSSLHFDNQYNLTIKIEHEAGKSANYKVGVMPGVHNLTSIFFNFIGLSKKVHIADKVFYLDDKQIDALKSRTVTALPLPDSIKSAISKVFDKLFKNNEIFEEQITQVIDIMTELDRLQSKASNLLQEVSPLSQEKVDWIFAAEAQIQSILEELGGKNLALQQELHALHDELMVPLIAKARLQSILTDLALSKDIKDKISALFDELSKRNQMSEKAMDQVIQVMIALDDVYSNAHSLFLTDTPFAGEDLKFIFAAESKVKEVLDGKNPLHPVLQQELENLYQSYILPLMVKAKQQIKQEAKHLAISAAAEKGKALQSGLRGFKEMEEKKVSPSSMEGQKVIVFPSSATVYKKGGPKSKEEEYQIDALMSLSMEHGTVGFFTFSHLTTPLSSRKSLSRGSLDRRASLSRQIEAKPYIDGMLTFADLLKDPQLYANAMQKLNLDSELKAVLTAEFQFLDLHQDNLAIIPLLSRDEDCFCKFLFSYGLRLNVRFSQLYKDFLSGHVNEDTKIFYASANGVNQTKDFISIKEVPGLLDALNSPVEFVLFDTDYTLAESNEIQQQERDGTIESLIPLRSVLLATDWKDTPLHLETMIELQSLEREQRIRDWVNVKDSPIRAFFRNQKKIDELLKEKIEKKEYTLSYHRSKGDEITLKSLGKRGIDVTVHDLKIQFASDLANLNEHQEFWKEIQSQLEQNPEGWFKPYLVKEGDELADIAKRHRLTVDELKSLNASQNLTVLKPGTPLKVKADLTSDTPSAVKQRQKIARQLFPRLSWKQRDALFERQARRRQYFANYETLQKLDRLPVSEALTLLTPILSSPSPLSTWQKLNFKNRIAKIREKEGRSEQTQQDFVGLLRDLQEEFRPTYFNLTKVMYPLLADAYELNFQLANRNEQMAGNNIGLHSWPLEETLGEAERWLSSHPDSDLNERLLITKEHLKMKLDRVQGQGPSTAFFGIWEKEESTSPDMDLNPEPKEKTPSPS